MKGKLKSKFSLFILWLTPLLLILLLLPYMGVQSAEFEEYDCAACLKDHHSLCEESCIDHGPEDRFACLHDCQQVSCASICSPTPEKTPDEQNQNTPECDKESEDCSKPEKETESDES